MINQFTQLLHPTDQFTSQNQIKPAIKPIAKHPKIFTIKVGQAKPSRPKGKLPKESSSRIEIIQRNTLPIAPPRPTKTYGGKCMNIRVLPLHS